MSKDPMIAELENFIMPSSDFTRTSTFIQGYADYISHPPGGYIHTVTMTATSNNPNGVVTYVKGNLSRVVPYLGQTSSYFIMSENKADQYYSDRTWDPHILYYPEITTTPGMIYTEQNPFNPKATEKEDLSLFTINMINSNNLFVGAHVGYDFIYLVEDNGVLHGFSKYNPSTMYTITLQKNSSTIPR